MLNQYGDELFADFFEYYSMNLRKAVVEKELTAKEIMVLIRQLPTGSRTVWKVGGYEPKGRLDRNSMVLMDIADLMLAWISAHSDSKEAKEYPRPLKLGETREEDDGVMDAMKFSAMYSTVT